MLFRQEALEKLSSPQQLDEAIRVTSPMTWVLIAVLVFAAGTALAWSIIGTTYTRVIGPAFIVYDEPKIAAVVATGNGTDNDCGLDLFRNAEFVCRGSLNNQATFPSSW